MSQDRVHVAIATDHLLANLIPLKVLNPKVCWLLVSDAMRKQAESYKHLVEETCPDTQLVFRFALPDSGVDAIFEFLIAEDEAIKAAYPDAPLDYNASGGTKLMAIIAYQVFGANPDSRVLYTSTDRNEIEVVEPQGADPIKIPSLNDERTYLLAYGLIRRKADSDDPNWVKRAQERKGLSTHLAHSCQLYGDAYSLINGAAARYGKQKEKHQSLNKVWGSAKKLLGRLNDEKLLGWSKEQANNIYFYDEESAKYVSGAWLEEYVWNVANELGFDEVSAGLDITTREQAKKNIRNELDCVITHNNRLLVIECKSGQFGHDDQKDTDILNKLESLGRRAGGIMGSTLLVSAQSLNHETRNKRKVFTSERAQTMKISVLEERFLPNLRDCLEQWRDTGHLPLG